MSQFSDGFVSMWRTSAKKWEINDCSDLKYAWRVALEVDWNSNSSHGLVGWEWKNVSQGYQVRVQCFTMNSVHCQPLSQEGRKGLLWDICEADRGGHGNAQLSPSNGEHIIDCQPQLLPFHPYSFLTEAVLHPASSQQRTESTGATKPAPFCQHIGHLQWVIFDSVDLIGLTKPISKLHFGLKLGWILFIFFSSS